ncbi:MAG TPA: hypothetical protein PKI14_15490 [Fervidobacterium sp.]|nr:hypothetical protein [Fervidobacterium sp.]
MAEKVKVKLLRNIVLNGYRRAGEIIIISDYIAQKLIDAKMATPIIEVCQPNLFDEGDCG